MDVTPLCLNVSDWLKVLEPALIYYRAFGSRTFSQSELKGSLVRMYKAIKYDIVMVGGGGDDMGCFHKVYLLRIIFFVAYCFSMSRLGVKRLSL